MEAKKDSSQPVRRGSGEVEIKTMGLNERLGLIALIDEGIRGGSSETPTVSDLFNDLWDLVNATVSGRRIELEMHNARAGNAEIKVNLPLLTIQGRGNAYSLTCFVPWNLEGNRPRLMIDFTRTDLEAVCMA